MSSQPTPLTIIIRHTGGSKKGQTEKFPVGNDLNIRIGRGPDNNVSFDPVKEDTISREHCVIRLENFTTDTFQIIDSQSRNGTFVNGKRITEKTTIFAGDMISLGKDGPSMEFDVDPRPASHVKKTRVLDAVKDSSTKETKAHEVSATAQKAVPAKDTIGKQTMQHMLQQSERKSKKGLWISLVALLILGGTAGFLLYKRKPVVIVQNKITSVAAPATASSLTVAQIAKANDNKVVYIEMGWKLVITQTGDQLFHVYLPVKEGGQTKYVAAYIRNNQGLVEPYLATKSYAPVDATLEPIGGFGSGSGFVVDERGFIITNRHVAASWLTSYNFPNYAFPGVLVEFNSKGEYVVTKDAVTGLSNWVPAEAMNYNRQLLETGIKGIDGELAYLDVTFANNSLRTPAKVVRISNTHDVAMIKIDLPEPLNKVTMLDNYKEIETGSVVVVLGYPGMSPDQYVANRSQDFFNRNPNIVKVPVPTVSTGNIGRLVKGSAGTSKVDEYLSMMGDYYQLTINSTGAGNSGGPMYDDQGRVVGIYSAGSEKMSYAIPIKYAVELMGRQAVIK